MYMVMKQINAYIDKQAGGSTLGRSVSPFWERSQSGAADELAVAVGVNDADAVEVVVTDADAVVVDVALIEAVAEGLEQKQNESY